MSEQDTASFLINRLRRTILVALMRTPFGNLVRWVNADSKRGVAVHIAAYSMFLFMAINVVLGMMM